MEEFEESDGGGDGERLFEEVDYFMLVDGGEGVLVEIGLVFCAEGVDCGLSCCVCCCGVVLGVLDVFFLGVLLYL